MKKSHTKTLSLGGAMLLAGSLVLAGCSSSPSEDELRQLNQLKDEVASLQRQVSQVEQQKAALEKEIADKNAKLRDCQADQQVVRQRLGK
jgi:outer membrane murein-binding lipoprotein Lpp